MYTELQKIWILKELVASLRDLQLHEKFMIIMKNVFKIFQMKGKMFIYRKRRLMQIFVEHLEKYGNEERQSTKTISEERKTARL